VQGKSGENPALTRNRELDRTNREGKSEYLFGAHTSTAVEVRGSEERSTSSGSAVHCALGPFMRGSRMHSPSPTRIALGASVLVAGLLVTTPLGTVTAADTVDDAPLVWLEGELIANSSTMPSSFDPTATDFGLTLDAVLALTLGGRGDQTIATSAAAAVEANIGGYITGEAFGDTGSLYSGAVGKTLLTAGLRGDDVNDFGGRDLEALSRGAVETEGLQIGRFSDVSTFGNFSNGFGQALNIAGLSYTPDGVPASAAQFLLDQQCPNGAFRLSYGGDVPTRGCESDDQASTDATSLAMQALLTLDPSDDVETAIDAGIEWMLGAQAADGSFGGSGPTAAGNANSTGLASQALLGLGETEAAEAARAYVMTLQLADSDATGEAGAIAVDGSAFVSASTEGIDDGQRDQFRRATSQGVLAYGLAPFGVAAESNDFTPVAPSRLLDTRDATALLAGEQLVVAVAGNGGVADDASAASLNITAVRAAGAGFVTVWDCSTPRPTTSSVNFSGPAASPNSVISQLSDDGEVCVYSSETTDVLVDLGGFFPARSGYAPLPPTRLLDTRNDTAVVPGTTVEVAIEGASDGAVAAVLNVTAVRATDVGFLTVWDCSTPAPATSSVNYSGPAASPNTVISKLSDDGSVCIDSSSPVDVLVDAVGVFPVGSSYTAVDPVRALDTRTSTPATSATTVKPLEVTLADVPAGATAVALNVTAVRGTDVGFVTVWDCSVPRPDTSSVNFSGAAASPNSVISQLSDDSTVCLYASTTVDLIVDVSGYIG